MRSQSLTTSYPDWPWSRVKCELELRGLGLAEISRRAGKSGFSAKQVKNRPIPSLQAAIAAAIGLSPLAIWPSRYHADGMPVRPVDWLRARGLDCNARPLPNPSPQPAPEQKDEAA